VCDRVRLQLGFVELVNGDKEPPVGLKDKANLGHVSRHVDMHWHDRLEHPVTRYTIGRLSASQRSNRFFRMLHLAKKNPLAKARPAPPTPATPPPCVYERRQR